MFANSSTLVPLFQLSRCSKDCFNVGDGDLNCVTVVSCGGGGKFIVRSFPEYLRSSEESNKECFYLIFKDRISARFFWAYAQSKTYSLFINHLLSRRLTATAAREEYINGFVPDYKSSKLAFILPKILRCYDRFEDVVRKPDPDQRRSMVELLGLSSRLDPRAIEIKRSFERHAHLVVGVRWDVGFVEGEEVLLKRWLSSSVFGYKSVRLGSLVDSCNLGNKVWFKTRYATSRDNVLFASIGRKRFQADIQSINLSKNVDGRYVCLFFNCGILSDAIKGRAVNGMIEVSDLLDMPIVVPPQATQTEIINKMLAQKRAAKEKRSDETHLKTEAADMIDSLYLNKEDDANV